MSVETVGLHPVAFPFRGHGVLTIAGKSTGSMRGQSAELVLEQINALGLVTASLDDRQRLVLTANEPISIGGHQDVLDVLGLVANQDAP